MGDGRFVASCVIKIQNKLKYNFSSTNWLENFQSFELWRVIFPGIFPTGDENWFESAGVSNIIEGSRNRGQNYSVRVK